MTMEIAPPELRHNDDGLWRLIGRVATPLERMLTTAAALFIVYGVTRYLQRESLTEPAPLLLQAAVALALPAALAAIVLWFVARQAFKRALTRLDDEAYRARLDEDSRRTMAAEFRREFGDISDD